ncbi:MAG TPA: trehalose-6-phosphate synthase [Actinomycetes bacterium]|nr:trehalose-6-phosphate synthase [Actinomycetes bacterium]
MAEAPLVLASNRGPVSFTEADDGAPRAKRGGGGLVSALGSIHGSGALWVCAALSDADRRVARAAPGGRLDLAGHETGTGAVRMLPIDPSTLARAYNGIANSTLWFVHHLLYAIPTAPSFDATWRREWAAYRAYNEAFADAVAEEVAPGGRVLVQDYHLALAPAMLRARRPDLRIGHFSHTPWAPPDYFRVLPDDVARAVLEGVLGADRAGFLSPRWARAFLDCAAAVLGARVDPEAMTVEHDGRRTQVGVHALGVDAADLRARADQPDVRARIAALRDRVGDRLVITRIDRTELSKNIVRGLVAYRELLRTHPEWQGRVTHLAFAYPSRHDIPEYREYTAAVQRVATEIEEEFGTDDWSPLVLAVDDDYARSLAAYRIADVLLVNPVRDGMNLVAKEGPILADHGAAVVLSTEAGAADEMAEDAFLINPYDVCATAQALHEALSLPPDQRRARSDRLAAVAAALPPQRWLAEQVDALDGPPVSHPA